MSRTQEFTFDTERLLEFTHSLDVPRVDNPFIAESDETGRFFSELLVLRQNGQIPELKTLFDIVKAPDTRQLSLDEKEAQFRILMSNLEVLSKIPKHYGVPEYRPEFLDQFAAPSKELRGFLSAISSIDFKSREPGSVVASSCLALLDPDSTNATISDSIITGLRAFRDEASDKQIFKDIERNGIRVRKGDQVIEFKIKDTSNIHATREALTSWGLANGLSGEQIGFTLHFADQANLYAGSYQAISRNRDKKLYPQGDTTTSQIKGGGYDPRIILDISNTGTVTITCQDRCSGSPLIPSLNRMGEEQKDIAIGTYTSDISALRGDEFIPGLASNPVSFKIHITIPDISKYRLIVPEALLPKAPTTSNLEIFARNKIRGAYETREIASVFSEKLSILRPYVDSLRAGDPRFANSNTISDLATQVSEREFESRVRLMLEDRDYEDGCLKDIANIRKNLLTIADNISDPTAKEKLYTTRDGIFHSLISRRSDSSDLVEPFIQKEVEQIETLSDAIGAIKLAPVGRRELYIERMGFQDPAKFVRFCKQAVTKEVSSYETLSPEANASICRKLLELHSDTGQANPIDPRKIVDECLLEQNVSARKALLNLANTLDEGEFKNSLLRNRDRIFTEIIDTRPDLVQPFIQKEVEQISTLSEAIQTIKLAPDGMREAYIQQTGLRDPERFAAFCERAAATEVMNEPTLSHEKIRLITEKLEQLNALTDPALITSELSPRQIFPESFVRQIATNNDVPVTGSILSAAALVGGIAEGLNYVGGSDPKAILLGDTGLLTRKLRAYGSAALDRVGYRGAGSKTPPLPDSVSPAGGAASSARTSPVGAVAGVSPTPPPKAKTGFIEQAMSWFGRRTPSPPLSAGARTARTSPAVSAAGIDGSASSFPPLSEATSEEAALNIAQLQRIAEEFEARRGSQEASAPSNPLSTGRSARALQTGIPETRPRAGSSSAELTQLAATGIPSSPDPHPSEGRASTSSEAATAAGAVKSSLESSRGRGRSSALSEEEFASREASSPTTENSAAAIDKDKSARAAYTPRAPSPARKASRRSSTGRGVS